MQFSLEGFEQFTALAKKLNVLGSIEVLAAEVEWADTMGPTIASELQKVAPYVTGRLQGSIRYQRGTGAEGVQMLFQSNVPYVPYVINGTAPHDIYPVAAKALAWPTNNPTNFAMAVHHPGSKPNNFPQRVMDSMRSEIIASFVLTVGEAVKAAGFI